MTTYADFLAKKRLEHKPCGFDAKNLHRKLFPFQKALVKEALVRGRSAIFSECGTGKTRMQIEWANHVAKQTGKPILIVAPLIVCEQTVREGKEVGVEIQKVKRQSDIENGPVFITNYERVEDFNASEFGGIVLDESSILKSLDGKTRAALIEQFRLTPYRLACTATPAPNDVMELGGHSEFLGIMTQAEMLSMYFVHDGGETQKWRLKRHARKDFWRWVGSWATMMRHPKDLGFPAQGFDLPELILKEIVVSSKAADGMLIAMPASTLGERLSAYRNSMAERVDAVAKLCNGNSEQWIIWCRLNDESEAITQSVDGAIEITGSDDEEVKSKRMMDFIDGKHRALVTKSKIAGFGANLQNCHNMIFAGVTDSFEQYYQAVRRCWRFGQAKPVNVYVVGSEAETSVFQNLKRKQGEAEHMAQEMMATIRAAKGDK